MENTLDGPVHNLVPPKCRCGTPLHPQYTQQEGSDRIAVTPVPQHIDPYTLPAGDWFDPLAWGATPEDVRVWQTGERQPAHDILARRGTRVASGACVPTFTPHPELLGEFPVRTPRLDQTLHTWADELRAADDAMRARYRRATWQPVQEADLLGEFPIAPRYAPFASEQDLLDAIDRETAKARMARVLLDDPRGVPPAYPPSREINAEDIERIMRREPRLDPNQYDRVRKLLLANLIPQGLALECPSALQDIYDATLDPADETFRSCYPSYPPKEPPPDGTL